MRRHGGCETIALAVQPLQQIQARARRRSWLWAILTVALVLRLAHWLAIRSAPFVAQPVLDSAEYARWGHSIAAGNWLGSAPFFQAPLYPYLLAVVFRLGGGLDAVYLLQIAAAVAGLAALAVAADRMLGRPHGLIAAALGAFYLPAVFHDVLLVKESIATSLVCVLLWLLARAREKQSAGAWLAAGVLVGMLSLLRENMLLVTLFLLPLVFLPGIRLSREEQRASSGRSRWIVPLVALVVGIVLPLAPVAARNAALGGGFLPTTFQGGVNFWIGNNPQADGTYRPIVPGKQVPTYERLDAERLAEQAVGRKLDGAQVSSYWLDRSLDWARRHPLDFVRLQLHKLALYFSPYEWPDTVDYYWMKTRSWVLSLPGLEWGGLVPLAAIGLLFAFRRWWALAPVLLFELGWLASTVAFFLFSRYRLPAAPGLWILAAVPLVAVGRGWRARGRTEAVIAGCGLLFVWLLPYFGSFAPRRDLVEMNLGRLAEQRGNAIAAKRHFEAALAADPTAFTPHLDLGTLAARAGDMPTAIRRFRQAVTLQPASDDAHADLGAALLAMGDLSAAGQELGRALALNPDNLVALQNRAVLELKRGKEAAARADLERLLRLDPRNAFARRVLARQPPAAR